MSGALQQYNIGLVQRLLNSIPDVHRMPPMTRPRVATPVLRLDDMPADMTTDELIAYHTYMAYEGARGTIGQ
jgi:hypothetical protein